MLRIAFSIYPGVLGNVNGGELDWAEEHEAYFLDNADTLEIVAILDQSHKT